jgi:hypothetical protein
MRVQDNTEGYILYDKHDLSSDTKDQISYSHQSRSPYLAKKVS